MYNGHRQYRMYDKHAEICKTSQQVLAECDMQQSQEECITAYRKNLFDTVQKTLCGSNS